MNRGFLSILVLCGAMAGSAAAGTVKVPMPPVRPSDPVADDAALDMAKAPDIVRGWHAGEQKIDPIRLLNDHTWDWRHRVGYRADGDRDCITALHDNTMHDGKARQGELAASQDCR